MGDHEEWPLPTGLRLNGLLPNVSSSVIRVLDGERWAKAEERASELIACIQPNRPSENRRRAVADYVQRLIMRCFPCQVFTFGSVPLKTYLPDGDIDLTAFSRNQILRDTWAVQVRDILESEEKNENAEFRVKEVQYIQAEVKIIKCLVENIVVDISYNQLGGLCTLCFLEEVDNLINQAHLFKRSIILIKAWCYYESRILGAHHGLISTYALETLVLYIFHIFNNSFSGPLEVLFRFLEFFSNFDWENFCVSLWGPVAVSSLPDINVEPPRRDSGELLLSKAFLEACNSVYAVLPGGLENQGQTFISKHFNVIDPLRIDNNLGRSVNKGNFYRIRSAFAFGAKRLAKLLDCPKENIATELQQFFMNTWERHGSGIRPDASLNDLLIRPEHCLRPSNPDHGSDNPLNCSNSKENNDDPSIHVIDVKPPSSQSVSYPLGSTSCDDLSENGNSKLSMQSDRSQRTFKHEQMLKPLQGKRLFTRTRSSPELTYAYCEASSRLRLIRPVEGSRGQVPSTKMDNRHRKSVISETVATQSTVSSSDDPHQLLDVPANSTRVSNNYFDHSGIVMFGEDRASVIGAQGMQQEEQDLVNMMASSSFHNFGRHVHMPLNLALPHLSQPISPGVLASMGYAPRNVAGMFPAHIPILDPRWATNFQFHQGLSSSPSSQYFPAVGLSTNTEAGIEHGEENFSYMEKRRGVDFEYWHDQDSASNGGFDPEDETLDGLHADDSQPSISGSSNLASSFHMRNSGDLLKVPQKFSSEHPLSSKDDYVESFQHHDNLVTDTLSHERTSGFARYCSASQASSVKSETSSENSWDGSSAKVSRAARQKWGRKAVKGKNIHEYPSPEVDDGSRDCSTSQSLGNEIDGSITAPQPAPTLLVDRHHIPGFEGPMVLSPGYQQRGTNYSGTGRFTFFPTGPPVPFFTVLPVYNCPSQAGSSEPSSSQLGVEDVPGDGDSGQNIKSSEQHDAVDVSNVYNRMTTSTAGESSEEPKLDILNSDFISHWQNLEFGRFCQVPSYPGSVISPSPVAVPPMYIHGRFPWDGPGRPISANADQTSQLMSYGHHIVPGNPLQSDPSRPSVVYQRHADELPRYRSGTGTYLPNPNVFAKDRHSSVTRRNSHNHDTIDQADREGNWNTVKSRSAGRSQSRTQAEKSRVDRPSNKENRVDRPWDAYSHQPPAYHTQNGQLRVSSSNMTYGMYPGEVSLNGANMHSVVMLSPNGHSLNSGYVSPGDQHEFVSLGPVGYVGPTDAPQQESRGSYEDQRYQRSSIPQSSPDTPSPHF